MASTIPSGPMYQLRLTMDEIDRAHMKYFNSHGLILCVRELGSETKKLHYHLLFITENAQALKKYVQRNIEGGNDTHAWKRMDRPYDALKYLCKGADKDTLPEVYYNIGCDIEELHKQYWITNHEKYGEKSDGKKVKSRAPYYRCYEDIKETIRHIKSTKKICSEILYWYWKEDIKFPTKFNLTSMAESYFVKVNGEYLDSDLGVRDAIDYVLTYHYSIDG